LKLTAPRENDGRSICFCGPFRLFSRIFVHVCLHHPAPGPTGAGPAFPEFVPDFISSPHFSFKSLIGLLLVSHGWGWPGRHRRGSAWPICGARLPSAALGRQRRCWAAFDGAWPPSAALSRHRRPGSLAAICGARPLSTELGRHLLRWAAFGGVGQPFGSHRQSFAAICSARSSSALNRQSLAAICGARLPLAMLGRHCGARPPSAELGRRWLRLAAICGARPTSLGFAGLSVLWDCDTHNG
jgi:hypothetical protein